MVVKPNQPARQMWYVAVVLLAVIAAILVFENWLPSDPGVPINAAMDPNCDLRAGPCTSLLNDDRGVRFSIEPRSIPPLAPLQLRVDTIGFNAREANVDLNGIGMQMGFNRVALSKHPQGYFAGTGTLSVCIRDVMEWEAVVTLVGEDMRVSAPFRFITTKNAGHP